MHRLFLAVYKNFVEVVKLYIVDQSAEWLSSVPPNVCLSILLRYILLVPCDLVYDIFFSG